MRGPFLLKLIGILHVTPVGALKALLVPPIHIAVYEKVTHAAGTTLKFPEHHIHHLPEPCLFSFVQLILGVKIWLVCDFYLIVGMAKKHWLNVACMAG
jgi:hypothetical protein